MFRITMCLVLALMSASSVISQPSEWISRGRGGGGGQFNPSFSPHNPDELYIGCDMGEFFHSTDCGSSWELVPFHQLTSNNYTAVRFTSDPQILYALDSEYGARPVKSTDGGATWIPTADPTGEESYSLFVDPNRSDRLLLSSYSDLFVSNDGGVNFSNEYTADGLYLAGAFFDADTIYVATSAGMLRSQNGGASFSLFAITGLPVGAGFVSFAGAREGAVVRFVCTVADQTDLYPGLTGSDYGIVTGVYTHTPGDGSWTNRSALLPVGALPFYAGMAINEADVMYLAGTNDPYYHPSVWKSSNGGASWSAVMNTVNNVNVQTGWCGWSGDESWGWAGNALGFAVAPLDANRLAITDYGFNHVSIDGGASWSAKYILQVDLNPAGVNTPDYAYYHSNGLEPTSVWHLEWMSEQNLFASITDIESAVSIDGGESWAKANIDPTGAYHVNTTYRAVKHPSGLLYTATSSIHDLYQSTYLTDARIDGGDGQVFVSSDSGRTFSLVHDFNHPVVWIDLDPNDSDRMIASVVHSTAGGIFLTENLSAGAASTWTRLSTPPRTEGHPYTAYILDDGAIVCTYSGRRGGNPQAFTQSSGVYYSDDSGASWEDRSDPMMIYWTKDIAIDPHDPSQSTWFVAVHRGWGGPPNELGGLFKTTNRGESWTRINSDQLYAESCTPHPLDENIAYFTTETSGLWYTENLRDNQPEWSLVESYPFMHPLRVLFNPNDANEVWIMSFGNGMRVGYANLLSAPTALTITRENDMLHFRWNPVVGATSYQIWSSTDASADPSEYELVNTTAETSSVLSLPPEGMRVYFVRAE